LREGAKVFVCKRGKDEGKKFAKFKDAKGHIAQARLTKSGDKILIETQHYHIEFEDNNGIRRRLKAYTNERASERLADKIESLLDCQRNSRQPDDELSKWLERIPATIRDELIEFSLLDAQRTAAGKTLDELISKFDKSLQAKERTPKYIKETVMQLRRVFDGCKFRYWSNITPTQVETYLKDLRERGIGHRRSNAYLKSTKQFCKWVVESGYAGESPVKYLKALNEAVDRRRERRAATPDELRRLLEATIESPKRYGMSGCERSLLYRLAAETGLRADEIRTLTVGAFDFDDLTVTVKAGYSKHREKDVLPLKKTSGLLAKLREFFAGKMPGVKAFGGTYKQLTDSTADMLKADLADAKIPYIDDNGEVLDFHALRHTFITNLRNAPSRVAQSLARHKSSAMTDRYTHIRVHDERAALDGLPDLSLPSKEKQQAVKTGTDDSTNILLKSCFQCAPMRSNTENSGTKNVLSVQKTPLCINNEGAEQSSNPKVAGSSPAGRVQKPRFRYR